MAETIKNPFVEALLKDAESVASAIFADLQKSFEAEETPEAPEEAATDPTVEAFRLLKKAEAAAVGQVDEAEILLQIADRHLRVIEAALLYQR
jgi:hypothetical protein